MTNDGRWIEELQAVSRDVEGTFGGLSQETLHRKAADGGWSVAECLEHLTLSNTSYFPLFESLTKGDFQTPWLARIAPLRRWMGNLILGSVSDGGERKMKTFPIWDPPGDQVPVDPVGRFLRQQSELVEWVRRLEPFIRAETPIRSPVSPLVVYTLPRALDIVVAHERRHLEQARRNLS